MGEYYIRIATYGTPFPDIIDDETMFQAEIGMNYLDPEEFMYLCDGDSMHDAEEQYFEEFSQMSNDEFAEKMHP